MLSQRTAKTVMDNEILYQTGQEHCYDQDGRQIACPGTGQDAEHRYGRAWPAPRFAAAGAVVHDHLTGLSWTKDANIHQYPLAWDEAFALVGHLNRSGHGGFCDWRLPNRRELASLLSYQSKRPVLPASHPFINVFPGWYWTSTTASINTRYAWAVHMDGARMFYGAKNQEYLLWPVRGVSEVLLRTGQSHSYSSSGQEVRSAGSGQDGEEQIGRSWPQPRFIDHESFVIDLLTGLHWHKQAAVSTEPVTWQESLSLIAEMNTRQYLDITTWQLPNITMLESLVDCSCHSPALPAGHCFHDVQDTYWSSTTSYFATDWAWALYLEKGAVGVGYKKETNFFFWPVAVF